MYWRMDTQALPVQVSPFRNLRIIGYVLLPEAYRSLSRLSSALSAKASTLRSYLLDQNLELHRRLDSDRNACIPEYWLTDV